MVAIEGTVTGMCHTNAAAKQNQENNACSAAVPLRTGQGDHPTDGGEAQATSPEEAEAGMAQMSEMLKDTGSELYMGAGDREKD